MKVTILSQLEPAASLPYRPNAGCANCRLRRACLPRRLSEPEVASLSDSVDTRIRLKKREVLFSQGDTHNAIYAVRSGTLKTQWVDHNQATHITGIHIAGELLGFYGLFENRHAMTAIALDSVEVCMIRLTTLDILTPEFPQIQAQIRGFMSGELIRLQKQLAQTKLRSEQRLARFLLDLSTKYSAVGRSSTRFALPMTYSDMGSLLGMTLETVSRLMAAFVRGHVLVMDGKQLNILDRTSLAAIAIGGEGTSSVSG